ncbi:MAG: enoyl-CoA hydratase/isomerase family protein, partial [Ferruginibacter sp.]|nr:enoyl-CoA hydratase/isomerase family protein [Chitinophagaceae bacterium]
MASVLFEIKDTIGFITLNRPEKLNSFNREMALLLQEALDLCRDKKIRCVYITGAGKAFSAGQDLAEVADPDGPGMKKILVEHYNPILIFNQEVTSKKAADYNVGVLLSVIAFIVMAISTI